MSEIHRAFYFSDPMLRNVSLGLNLFTRIIIKFGLTRVGLNRADVAPSYIGERGTELCEPGKQANERASERDGRTD